MPLDFSHAKYPPFQHQREDTQTLIEKPFFFITSEMRTGKTKIVIDAAQFLYHSGKIDRMIVIAPAPVRGVWVGVFSERLTGELGEHLWNVTPALVTEYHSNKVQWRVGPPSDKPLKIVVTNYEFIRPYRRKNSSKFNEDALNALLKIAGPRTLLVLDESGAITNHKSSQYKSCKKLRDKVGRAYLLNGTPMDTPIHLFAQGNMLHESILQCKYVTHFKNRYAQLGGYRVGGTVKRINGKPVIENGKPVMEGGRPTQIVGWNNLDDLRRRFAPYTVRRLQADCLDLPPKLAPVTLKAQLTNEVWDNYYKSMRDEAVASFGDGAMSVAQQAITKLMRLSQMTGGFLGGVSDNGLDPLCEHCFGDGCDMCEQSGIGAAPPVEAVVEIGREKLDVLLWLVQDKLEKDPNAKMVVWLRFAPETQRAIRELQNALPHVAVVGLHGGQSKQDRARAKTILHPSTAPTGPVVLLVTLGTGSFGFDFSAANISINYAFDHSLRKFLQAQDRVYGPRQTRPIEYYDIIAVGPKGQKTYDTAIVQARLDKQDIASWTVDAWVKALGD